MAEPVARKLIFRGWSLSAPGQWVSGLPSFAVAVVALFCADSLNSAEVERVPLLAQVGKTEVLSIDLGYRSMVERCYRNGEEVGEAAAFLLLLQDAMDREIARAYGLLPTEEEIDAFDKHVYDTSRARDRLNAIEAGFGEDEEAYRRVFLEPRVVDRKLRAYQAAERTFHRQPLARIEAAWSELARGADMKQAARAEDLRYEERALSGASEEVGALYRLADSLEVGQVFENIVEDEDEFRILYLKDRNGKTLTIETIAAPKTSYDDWRRERVLEIEVDVFDHSLVEMVKEKYPDVWWLKRLKRGSSIGSISSAVSND